MYPLTFEELVADTEYNYGSEHKWIELTAHHPDIALIAFREGFWGGTGPLFAFTIYIAMNPDLLPPLWEELKEEIRDLYDPDVLHLSFEEWFLEEFVEFGTDDGAWVVTGYWSDKHTWDVQATIFHGNDLPDRYTKPGGIIDLWISACGPEALGLLWPDLTDEQRDHALHYVNAGMVSAAAGNMVRAVHKEH